MQDLVRHGDLLFRDLTHRPQDRPERGKLRVVPGSIIQRGEVTGHAHRLTDGEAAILEAYERNWKGTERTTGRFLEVSAPATIGHEEHKPVTLAPGLWEIIQAREFDYQAAASRTVRD